MSKQSDLELAAIIPRLLQLNGTLGCAAPDQLWQTWMNLELTMPQFKLLLLIASHSGLRVGDLAQRMGVTPPTVTTILDRLVEHGLVRRVDDPVDRRLVIPRLNDRGRDLLERLNVYSGSDLTQCIEDLAEEDLRCLLVGLEALHRAWQSRNARHANGDGPEAC